MEELFNLGALYVSDFIKGDEEPRGGRAELKLVMDEEKAVRLESAVDPSFMYGKYWYRSGTNASMQDALGDVVKSITDKINYKDDDIWLDIACNDGTLLKQVPSDFRKIGIDPVDETYLAESRKYGTIVQDFFSKEAYKSVANKKAKVITCIAMFYDIENTDKFFDDVLEILDDDGIFVVQMSYSPLMIQQMAFDNICHEHLFYYTMFSFAAKTRNKFAFLDAELNDVNGGSFRVFLAKKSENGKYPFFGTQPQRDVGKMRVLSLFDHEIQERYNDPQTWKKFYENILKLKEEVVTFITAEKEAGKSIWVYGASTKGNTLLQFFGLDNTLIDAAAERSPYKFGLKTVGTNIPIKSEAEMREANPDYLLVLPWHFINEFVSREQEYLKGGGAFIVPCPKFEVIREG